jgi:hypothetical protein
MNSFTKHAPNGEAVVAVVEVLPIHVTTTEVQVVGALNIRRVKRTRPIVAETANIVHTTIAAVARSRKKQYLGTICFMS